MNIEQAMAISEGAPVDSAKGILAEAPKAYASFEKKNNPKPVDKANTTRIKTPPCRCVVLSTNAPAISTIATKKKGDTSKEYQ